MRKVLTSSIHWSENKRSPSLDRLRSCWSVNRFLAPMRGAGRAGDSEQFLVHRTFLFWLLSSIQTAVSGDLSHPPGVEMRQDEENPPFISIVLKSFFQEKEQVRRFRCVL